MTYRKTINNSNLGSGRRRNSRTRRVPSAGHSMHTPPGGYMVDAIASGRYRAAISLTPPIGGGSVMGESSSGPHAD